MMAVISMNQLPHRSNEEFDCQEGIYGIIAQVGNTYRRVEQHHVNLYHTYLLQRQKDYDRHNLDNQGTLGCRV